MHAFRRTLLPARAVSSEERARRLPDEAHRRLAARF
jgi:hypothetical protein